MRPAPPLPALAPRLLPLPALAALQPCTIDAVVAEAARVATPKVEEPDPAGASTRPAEVARRLRDPLAPAKRAAASFPRANPRTIAGPATDHEKREVARAAAVELHLDADGAVAGHGWGLMVLDGVTEKMALPFEYLGAVEAGAHS